MNVFVTLAGAAAFLAVLWVAASYFVRREPERKAAPGPDGDTVGGGSGAFHSTLDDFGGGDGGGD